MNKKLEKIFVDWSISRDYGQYISIINYVNIKRDIIREKYLSFIKNLAIDKTNIDFNFNNEISIWEMSNIKEISLYKSNYITEILKLIALITLIENLNAKLVTIKHLKKNHVSLLENYFVDRNIKFVFKEISNEKKLNLTLFLKNICPSYLKAILFWVSHLYQNFYLIFKNPSKHSIENEDLILMGYLTHLKKEAINSGKFSSNLWGPLTSILFNKKLKPFFLHHNLKTNDTKNSKEAYNLINKFNNSESHVLLFSFLSFSDYFKILADFNILYFRFFNVKSKLKSIFFFKGINFFNFFLGDIKKSFNGTVLIENLIWIHVFRKFFSKQEKKIDLIFIQENQSWEIAMLYYFKKNSPAKINSLQNQSVRFWDLRYNYKYNINYDCNYYLVSGDYAYNQFIKYGYPTEKVVKVESLRYSDCENQIIYANKTINSVLLLGDYDVNETNEMLEELIPFLKIRNFTIGFKPHPAKQIKNKLLNKSNIKIETKQISALIKKYQFFIVTNKSGSSLDLFLLGEYPIIYLTKGQLNNSPLDNVKNILETSDKDEIHEYLKNPLIKPINRVKQKIFYLDKNYSKWDKFIKPP